MQEMPYHSPHRVLTVAGGHDVETVLPCHGVFDPLGLGWGQDLVSSDSLAAAAVFSAKFLVSWRINKIRALCSL